MPQPKRTSTPRPAAKRAVTAKAKPAAKTTAAAKPKAKAAAKPKATATAKAKPRATAAAKPKAAAKAKPRSAAKSKPRVSPPPAQRSSKRTAVARTKDEAARDVALFDNLGALRDIFAEHLVLTAERLQETLDDAVRRGRMLPDDAAEIAQRLRSAGRRQIDELLAEIDRRLRGR